MSKKVKIGIIGAGTIGSVHADAYAKVADAEVVALCDILADRLKEKAARHHIAKTYATHQELLAMPASTPSASASPTARMRRSRLTRSRPANTSCWRSPWP